MNASDALSALKFLYDVARKVKDNNDELIRFSRRIQHVVLAIEESRCRNIIRSDEYNDALTTISDFISRAQSGAQKLLKRNLGDRTWNTSEISTELRRLNDDVQFYLSVHTLRTLDLIHISNSKPVEDVIAKYMEELMSKIAELNHGVQNRRETGWALPMQPQAPPNAGKLSDVNFEKLRQSRHITLRVTGLQTRANAQDIRGAMSTGLWINDDSAVLDLRLRADAGKNDIMHAIEDAGFFVPRDLNEESKLQITVTEGDSVYDAAVPGGLQVNRSEPLLWWWNKYTTYHGLIPATTPGVTIVNLKSSWRTRVIGVSTNNVFVSFHRTLRVPDAGVNHLPENLGTLPLLPVDEYHHGVPPAIQVRGGFLMPMFRREAVRLEFDDMTPSWENKGSAIKVSVGGVNVVSGISTSSIEPPKFGVKQDYIVSGQQPWLDGIVPGQGVVRQFVAAGLGSGYTIEEQITGNAEIGGFQFDIFPRRPNVDGEFFHHGERVNSISTPSELGLAEGDQLILHRKRRSTEVGSKWSLVDYKRRVSPSATIKAAYYHIPETRYHRMPPSLESFLGLAVGGKIVQKIYRDKDSPRVYDEERGHRFFVHIITPELWEAITGVLPPITPITREMYTQNGVPWNKLFDDYMECVTAGPSALSGVLSVTQLDKQNSASFAGVESQLDDAIDPKAPQNCSFHPSATSPPCMFSPCRHLACTNCVSSAVLGGFKCPYCQATVKEFVGMQTPLPVPKKRGRAYPEGQWSAEETEELARAAVAQASSKAVIVIHQQEDRPSPLYSTWAIDQGRSRSAEENEELARAAEARASFTAVIVNDQQEDRPSPLDSTLVIDLPWRRGQPYP